MAINHRTCSLAAQEKSARIWANRTGAGLDLVSDIAEDTYRAALEILARAGEQHVELTVLIISVPWLPMHRLSVGFAWGMIACRMWSKQAQRAIRAVTAEMR